MSAAASFSSSPSAAASSRPASRITLSRRLVFEETMGKTQDVFRRELEDALNNPDERVRDAFLDQHRLALEETSYRGRKVTCLVVPEKHQRDRLGVAGRAITSFVSGAGFTETSQKQWAACKRNYKGRTPIVATHPDMDHGTFGFGRRGLEKLPIKQEKLKKNYPYQAGLPASDPRSLRSYVEWARAQGKLIDDGESKGAYILDTENSTFIFVPPSADAEDGYDYDKIKIMEVMNPKDGSKVDASTLRRIADSYRDFREDIEKAARPGAQYYIKIEHALGDPIVRLINYNDEHDAFTLEINDSYRSSANISLSDGAQKAHKEKSEKGLPPVKPKKPREKEVWVTEEARNKGVSRSLVGTLVNKDDPRLAGWRPSAKFAESASEAAEAGAPSRMGLSARDLQGDDDDDFFGVPPVGRAPPDDSKRAAAPLVPAGGSPQGAAAPAGVSARGGRPLGVTDHDSPLFDQAVLD